VSGGPVRSVAVVGAGAAGAFLALELARLRPDVRIDLYDRPAAGSGAGIVMSREFADRLRGTHPRAFEVPAEAMATWDRTVTLVGEQRIWSGAYGMFGLARRAFNEHLRELAARAPGVRLVRRAVGSLDDLDGFDTGVGVAGGRGRPDVVVLADGASSGLRQERARAFGTAVRAGLTRFLWMSTPAVLDPLFVLKDARPGLLIVHAYPHGAGRSTFIVEAHPLTLRSHGLLDRPAAELERELAAVFREELGGAELRAHTSGWQAFRTVTNERWYDGRTVLLGDAAHTVHFSTGLGTTLAVDDALCLARELAGADREAPAGALEAYARERGKVLDEVRLEARESRQWFEELSRRERVDGAQTVFALRSRRSANSYQRLRARDPLFVERAVDALGACAAGRADGAEPVDLPLALAGLRLTGRLVGAEHDGTRLVALRLPTEQGELRCPVLDTAPDTTGPDTTNQSQAQTPEQVPMPVPVPECVLLREAAGADVCGRAAALRAAGVPVVGLLVSKGRCRSRAAARGFDFLAVPARRGAGRVARSGPADALRYDSGLPVLLVTRDALPRDEANTLIAAGRIDLAVHETATRAATPAAEPEATEATGTTGTATEAGAR